MEVFLPGGTSQGWRNGSNLLGSTCHPSQENDRISLHSNPHCCLHTRAVGELPTRALPFLFPLSNSIGLMTWNLLSHACLHWAYFSLSISSCQLVSSTGAGIIVLFTDIPRSFPTVPAHSKRLVSIWWVMASTGEPVIHPPPSSLLKGDTACPGYAEGFGLSP